MKIKAILAAGAAAFALTSCMDGGNEYHSTYFYPVSNFGIETFADQTVDSVRVVSYDTWTLTNHCEWFDVYESGKKAPISVTVPAGYMSSNRLDLYLKPNTTGQVRSNAIEVVSSFNKIGSVVKTLVQYPFHNVIWPNVKRNSTDEGGVNYTFALNYPASAVEGDMTKNCVQFKVYGRNSKLASDSPWLRPAETEDFYAGKIYTVPVAADKNTTGAERTGTLTLSSEVDGETVKTSIAVVQAKPAEK